MLTRTLAELTRWFGVMEANLDRVLVGKTGAGASAICGGPRLLEGGGQAHLVPGGILLEPRLLHEYSTQHHHVQPFDAKTGAHGESHTQLKHGGIVVGKAKNLMETGESRKKDSKQIF